MIENPTTPNPVMQPKPVDIKRSKTARANQIVTRWLNQLQTMGKFEGGSESLPMWRIWQMLLRNGYGAIAPKDGKLHFLLGGLGGPLDENYFPTLFVGANPALKWSYSLKIGEECVLCKFDTAMEGVLPLLNYFATLIASNEQSLYIALVNSRATELINVSRDGDKKAADGWLRDLEEGKLASLLGNNILKGITTQPYGGKTGIITDLIELEQYLKASLSNDLGLDANYNMKRESLSIAEAQMNDDALFPYIEDIEANQKSWVDEVNEKWGELLELGALSFELGGPWARNKKEAEAVIEAIEEEATEEETPADPVDEVEEIQEEQEPDEEKKEKEDDEDVD